MVPLAVVSVVTRDYLPFARAMAMSVRSTSPEVPVYVCLADRPVHPLNPAEEPFTPFFADELGIPEWRRFAFQYTPFELSCALKPAALQHVARMRTANHLVYMDSDLFCYDSLLPVVESWSDASVVLTPHLLDQAGEATSDSEHLGLLQYGLFNAGMLGLRCGEESSRFLDWWWNQVARDCIDDPLAHRFVDQRFLDAVPLYFDGLLIEKHPGINVGYWRQAGLTIRACEENRYQANDKPLICFHFSGFDPSQPDHLTRRKVRCDLSQTECIREMSRRYAALLLDHGWSTGRTNARCAFDTLSDGTRIEPSWREAIRVRHAALEGISDPFDVSQHPKLKDALVQAGHACWQNRVGWRLARLDRIIAHPVLGRCCSFWRRWIAPDL